MNSIIFDKARFTVLTENLIRIEYSETGIFEDQQTQIVQNRVIERTIKFDKIEKNNSVELITSAIHLYYTGGSFTESSLFADVKFNFSDYANRWHYGKEILANLGGTARTLDGVDGTCNLDDGIMSKNGFAILKDESLVLSENDDIARKSSDTIDIYFFAYGRDYRQALKDFYHLTGNTPILPRFALGNWWSRYYEYSEESYLALIDKFSEKKIPLSVSVIDMDWHRVKDVPSKYGSGWTGYSWNKTLFPNPKRFLNSLQQRKLKVTLNDHPADGVRAFEDCYLSIAKRLNLDTKLEETAIFDFDDPNFREGYFEDVHRPLEEEGVDFWWLDWQQGSISTSGVDPLWLLNHYQYKDAQKKHENNIILSRYAGPGSHRYPIGFSGDTIVSWESLDFQPYFTSTATNIGYTWWSHDIGGHMQGEKDAELSLRWLQYGVFSPVNRLHSSKSEFTGKEPWNFDSVIEQGMTEMLQLRHALLPYLYTANVQTATFGQALVEPMYYEYPFSEEAYQHHNQYLFGEKLLVAPITKKKNMTLQMSSVNVWLPKGIWYDFFTGQKYRGNVELKVYREITSIPVFVKAGTIIPLDKNPLAREDFPSEIIWKVFPGDDGSYTLIDEHQGKTTVQFTNGIFSLVEEVPSARKHTIVYAGREVVTGLSGNFQLNLTKFQSEFNWNFEEDLFRRLDIAEIDYELKDTIFDKLKTISEFDKCTAYLKTIENRELQDSLFELVYCDR
ncbi:glycoside hydrolase family 31 protein [Lactococcus lactis]|uniref:glycoside hydrolase family 31 protein n=1 Tax=Lactococcus lactis TaxID=1358 RepID=UPI0022E729D8|nr:glycoside hydrolase family 31 protein [Lactococcus lactis]WNN67774.1 glycoside hydrolase family 31 protein [Lactococcus lactis]WPK09481.1 glycoside hydrolase family 31 protein [Lactococcus lactis]